MSEGGVVKVRFDLSLKLSPRGALLKHLKTRCADVSLFCKINSMLFEKNSKNVELI
jgi:hypothetical protein